MNTKVELINKVRSPDNRNVLAAVEELRVRGWLGDGTLRGMALCRVQFQGADLIEANLNSVDLHQADMEFADLSMADLSGAKMTRINLVGANMNQANIARADLYKANLRGVRNLTDEQLITAKRLWGSIMPDGSPYDGCYNLAGDLELARWNNLDTSDTQVMAGFYGVSLETYLEGQKKAAKLAK